MTAVSTGDERIVRALESAREDGRLALCPFVTAGFPDLDGFPSLVRAVASVADVVEIGVPFSDPMADGLTIQRASRTALNHGVSLRWIVETVGALDPRPAAPLVLMSYLNPLLAYGIEELARAAAGAGVSGFIVPDLPLEESGPLGSALEAEGVALIQLVTPVTPSERLVRLCNASRGFVYAVTVTGTTGGSTGIPAELLDYLDCVRGMAPRPVLAGFGIREPGQAEELAGHADGVIVGSALIERIEAGEDPVAFLRSLRVPLGGQRVESGR